MKTTKTIQDTPAPGHALLERTQDSFQRTRNGAWIAGSSRSEVFEIPLSQLNSTGGQVWLNPGRTGHVFIKLPDGSFLSVCGADDPIRTSGFGPLGILTVDGQEVFASKAHPLLPNLFVGYHRVTYYPDAVAATFEPLNYYVITYTDAAGVVVDTTKTGPFSVSKSFAEHVAKSGLIVRPEAVAYTLAEA